jgi:hypothetical protein
MKFLQSNILLSRNKREREEKREGKREREIRKKGLKPLSFSQNIFCLKKSEHLFICAKASLFIEVLLNDRKEKKKKRSFLTLSRRASPSIHRDHRVCHHHKTVKPNCHIHGEL